LVSSNSLGNGILVVVRTAAGLPPFSHAGSHGLRGAVEVDEVANDHLISQPLLKLLPVLTISRETIEKVPPVSPLLDPLLQQVDHQRRGQEFSLLHAGLDSLGKLPSLPLLRPEQLSRGEVFKLIVLDEMLSLRVLATAGPSE
jgi:hypothetical protein